MVILDSAHKSRNAVKIMRDPVVTKPVRMGVGYRPQVSINAPIVTRFTVCAKHRKQLVMRAPFSKFLIGIWTIIAPVIARILSDFWSNIVRSASFARTNVTVLLNIFVIVFEQHWVVNVCMGGVIYKPVPLMLAKLAQVNPTNVLLARLDCLESVCAEFAHDFGCLLSDWDHLSNLYIWV
jgi:hypothetical protein